ASHRRQPCSSRSDHHLNSHHVGNRNERSWQSVRVQRCPACLHRFQEKGDALFAPPPSNSRSQTWGEKRCPFFRWHGENNRYHGTAHWFSVDGKNAGIQNLRAWSELWQSTEAGSSEGSALSASEPSLSAAAHQAAFSK